MLEPGARAEPRRARSRSSREAARCLADDAQATEPQRGAAAAACSTCSRATPLPERLLELAGAAAAAGARAAAFSEARKAVERAALEELAAARPRAAPGAARPASRAAYARGEGPRVGARLRGPPARARATCCASDEAIREREQLRFRSIMVDEFQDTNRLQTRARRPPLPTGAGEGALLRRRRVPVDLRLPPRRRGGVPRAARGGRAGVLPLTLNYRSRPEVLAAVNELFGSEFGESFQPLAPAAGYGDPRLRDAGRAARHRQGVATRHRASTGAAPRRGTSRAACASSSTRAPRRRARSSCCSRPGPTRSGSRRSCGRVDLPTIRTTGRRYFGQQQVVDLLPYLRLLQNRYDDEALLTVLASPFVGVSNDALVLIRADAQRRPIFKGIERTLPADLAEERPAARCAPSCSATSGSSSARRTALAGAPLRAHPRRARLRPGRARTPRRQRRYANLRKLARLARSYEELRGPDLEGFIRFVAEQEARRRARARRRLRGGGRRRRPAAHDPRRQGARVQGRRRRRRRPRPARPRRTSSASPTAASGSRSPIPATGHAGQHRLLPGRQGARGPGRGGRAAAPLLRRDDPGDGAADRLGLGRRPSDGVTRRRRSAGCSSRLGLEEELARRGRRRRRSRSSAAGRRCCSAIDRGAAPAARRRRPASRRRRRRRRRASSRSSRARARACRRRRPRLRELAAIPEPPLPRRRPALLQRHLPLRPLLATATTPSGSSACGPRRGRVDGDGAGGGLHPTEIGDAVHRLLELVDLARPAARPRRPRGARPRLVPDRHATTSSSAYRRSRRARTASSALARAHRRARRRSRRSGRSPSSSTACSLNGRLDVLWRDGARRARARLQDERARRPRSGRDRRGRSTACSRPSTRSRACARGASEVEVVYQFLEAPDASSPRRSRRPTSRRLEGELGASIARIRDGRLPPDAERVRLLGLPGARPRLRRAALGSEPDGAAARS